MKYQRILSVLIMVVLLLNLLPPTRAFAAGDLKGLKLVDQGETFYFTAEYEGTRRNIQFTDKVVEILESGAMSDKNYDYFWEDFDAEEYFAIYDRLTKLDPETVYKYDQGNKGVKTNYDDIIGKSSSDLSDLKDLMFYAGILAYKDGNYNDITSASKFLDTIDTDHGVTEELIFALSYEITEISSDANITEMIESIRGMIGDTVEEEVLDKVADANFDKFYQHVKGIDKISDSSTYEDLLNFIALVSWKGSYTSLSPTSVFQKVEGIEVSDHDQNSNMKQTWDLINNSQFLTTVQKHALYSVMMGRHSYYESESMDSDGLAPPPPPVRAHPDTFNYELSAKEQVNRIKDILDTLDPASSMAIKQRRTFDARIKYHYYALHNLNNLEGNEVPGNLSASNSEDVHSMVFRPILFTVDYEAEEDFSIGQTREYVYLMNTLNELFFARNFIFDSGVKSLSANTVPTGELIEAIAYLKTLKAGIVFLESNTMYDFTEVIDYWYETVNGTSLEIIYQNALSLGYLDLVDSEQVKYDEETAMPFKNYFDAKDESLSLYMRMGMGNSARYLPLQTNLYEVSTYSEIDNEDFFNNFHYIWGFNRKALYIDRTSNAPVNLFNTGKVGGLSPVTLDDLLKSNGEVVLYSDTKFYNEHTFQPILDKAAVEINEKTEAIGEAVDKVVEAGETVHEVATNSLWENTKGLAKYKLKKLTDDMWESTSIDEVASGITQFAKATVVFLKEKMGYLDKTLLSKEEIDEQFQTREYSEIKSYAAMSALYRDKETLEYVNDTGAQPVFISSKKLELLPSTGYKEKSSIFNYALLQNIKANELIDYKLKLDLNSPLFIDVYGNISTTSGYVVIPAASNATLHREYNPYTAAFISTYGQEYKIPTSVKYPSAYDGSNSEDNESQVFEYSDDEKHWEFRQISIDSLVDLNNLSTADKGTQETLYGLTRKHMDTNNIDTRTVISNVIVPVMIGAPLEHIDLVAEGIKTNDDLSTKGVVQAYKLDQFKEALATKSQNVLIAAPNPAFMDGIEYIIFLMYKLGIIVGLGLIFIQIFTMTMRSQFNIFNIFKIAGTVALTVAFLFIVPKIYETTYYGLNKILLQDEVINISMLNLEKSESGSEIGIVRVEEPEINTKLYMKVEEIKIPWTDVLSEIVYSSIDNNLSKVYSSYANTHLNAHSEDMTIIEDAMYIDVQKLYDSSTVVFDPTIQSIYQQTKGELAGAFYSPYYVFLDALIAHVNEYNLTNQSYSYTTNTHSGGRLKSVGLIGPFLTSDEFIASEGDSDYLHLRSIYDFEQNVPGASPFLEDDINMMRNTLWYQEVYSDEILMEKIEHLNNHMKKHIVENRDLIGRISDETFLKTLALSLAVEYNKEFKIGKADSLDIFQLSSDDLVRMSIADKPTVMEGSSYSYSRFIFETSGELGVYLTAILELILFITGWIKPIVTILLFTVLFISVFVNRLILNNNNTPAQGILLIIIYLCITNALYAILLKASLFLPVLGVPSAICIIIQIAMHLVFIAMFAYIVSLVLRDPKGFGSDAIKSDLHFIKGAVGSITEKAESRKSRGMQEGQGEGWDTLREKQEQEEKRSMYRTNDSIEVDPPTAKQLDDEYRTAQKANEEPTQSSENRMHNGAVSDFNDVADDYNIEKRQGRVNYSGTQIPGAQWQSEWIIEQDGQTFYEYKYPDGRVETTDVKKNI